DRGNRYRGSRESYRRTQVPRCIGGAEPGKATMIEAVKRQSAPSALGRHDLRHRLRENGAVASIALFLIVVAAVFSLATDNFLSEPNLLNIIRQIAPLMITAVAMTFVITTGGIDLSVGSILALVNALAAISP